MILLEDGKTQTIKVKAQDLGTKAVVEQEIQGWVAMPQSHWKVIEDILAKYVELKKKQ